jgi:hypothetical protein
MWFKIKLWFFFKIWRKKYYCTIDWATPDGDETVYMIWEKGKDGTIKLIKKR